MYVLESHDEAIHFRSDKDDLLLRIVFVQACIVRVTFTKHPHFSDSASRIVVTQTSVPCELKEDDQHFRLSTSAISVTLNKTTGALSYLHSSGRLLTREPDRGGRWLTPKQLYRNLFGTGDSTYTAQSIDGIRATPADFVTIPDRIGYEAKLEFVFDDHEALFGLGSHEEGYGNLRGRSRELYQQNMKAVVPYFVSTNGYAVLLDCCSLMTFHDDALGSYWWADAVDELDYYVIQGDTFDDVTRGYHHLTGPSPMLPKWAFGFAQSKERYVNAQELVDVVREFRTRRVPLDLIVLDWKSWPNGEGWGQKSADRIRFPDLAATAAELHAMGAHLMVSIWPIMTGGCEDQTELLERGLMLGNQSTYNAFLDEARSCYWEQANRGLFAHGVDAWWCDCTEPFESDWSGAVKPEAHNRLKLNTEQSKLYLDATEINAYALLHSQGIYEGQRRTTSAKRVVNLTRSSYAGQHRYSTITWNGDICATWDTLRRCIPEGVNFCAAGEPYWTVDAGGFFIDNRSDLWFWRGDYHAGCRGLTDAEALQPDGNDTGCKDLGFWELYTRWMQYAAFLPIFRSHGTDAAREIWRFGDEGGFFYEAIAQSIRLRYALIPYIYSLAAQVTLTSTSMVRAVALDFPNDARAHHLTDQYLFGRSIMVCPVTHPMYYEVGSRPITSPDLSRLVYLPTGSQWFDFWTNTVHAGDQTLKVEAAIDRIPLFIRAGSIIPMAEPTQYVDELPSAPYNLRVYTGTDAEFALYEDAGDGYEYEDGAFALVNLRWTEATLTLEIDRRQGSFQTLVRERDLLITVITQLGSQTQTLRYRGEPLVLQFAP